MRGWFDRRFLGSTLALAYGGIHFLDFFFNDYLAGAQTDLMASREASEPFAAFVRVFLGTFVYRSAKKRYLGIYSDSIYLRVAEWTGLLILIYLGSVGATVYQFQEGSYYYLLPVVWSLVAYACIGVGRLRSVLELALWARVPIFFISGLVVLLLLAVLRNFFLGVTRL